MDRKKAWSHYFTTGDMEPLFKAYWKSVNYIAWEHFPKQQEDMFQIGMIGLLNAIKRLDRDRVKSYDAWVFLNVRNKMFAARKFKPTDRLNLQNEKGNMHGDLPTQPSTTDEYDSGILDSLPAREALIIRLVHLEKYKRTEVAKMFGLSSMRIGQLEQRALGILRKQESFE